MSFTITFSEAIRQTCCSEAPFIGKAYDIFYENFKICQSFDQNAACFPSTKTSPSSPRPTKTPTRSSSTTATTNASTTSSPGSSGVYSGSSTASDDVEMTNEQECKMEEEETSLLPISNPPAEPIINDVTAVEKEEGAKEDDEPEPMVIDQ